MKSHSLLLLAVALASVLSAHSATAAPATWVQLTIATPPPARYAGSMAFDPVSRKIVLFGGKGASGLMNDTWLFDGTNWTLVQTPTAPPARYGAAFAYDKATKKMVLFGGVQSLHVFFSDTWLWDGATQTWTQATAVHSPPGLTGAMAFTDPRSGRVMLFGGQIAQGAGQDTTYRWTGNGWKVFNLTPRPQPRAFGAMSQDFANHTIVLFGGESSHLDTDNTWIWDGYAWTLQSPPAQPPFTYFSSSGYDPALKSVVIFGGLANGYEHNITWSWDGSTWQEILPTLSPSPRSWAHMAYDPVTGQLILFGGTTGLSQFVNDTWQLQP